MLDTIKVLFILTGASTYLVTKNDNIDWLKKANSSEDALTSWNTTELPLVVLAMSTDPTSTITVSTSNHNVINNFTSESPISRTLQTTKMPSFSPNHHWPLNNQAVTINSIGSHQTLPSNPAINDFNDWLLSSNQTTIQSIYRQQQQRVAKDTNHYNHHKDRKKLGKKFSSSSTSSVIKSSMNDTSFPSDSNNNQLSLQASHQLQPQSPNQYQHHHQQQPVYEILINEEEKDLPKKLFQVKALMINDSNGTETKKSSNQPTTNQALMFILSGNGVDYENPEQSKFAINAFTGELFLISPLDRDPPNGHDLYRLIISAEDERSEKINGSVLVLVRVRDINDNAPYFEQNEYLAQVSENSGAGVDVIRVLAIDRDPDSIVRYSIEVNRVNSDGELIFDIDELSGLVSTAVCCLDRESIGQYTIKICATDRAINGDQQTYHWSNANHQNHQSATMNLNQSSCTNIIINVTDENDELPRFVRDRFFLTISEGVNELYPQRILLNTSVLDNDLPETNHFVCRLDVHLRFPIQVPTIKKNDTDKVVSLFWLFIKNETTNMTYHHLNLNKYFQCHINRYGNVRILVSDNFPPNYFHQILLQEFEHFRSSLWNRFRQLFTRKLPRNILQYKELLSIPLPNYVNLLIKILVSDLGYFEIIPQRSSVPKVASTTQHYDMSGLLDTHVISAELNLKLSMEPFVGFNQLDGNKSGIRTNMIINKQRILPYDSEANDDISKRLSKGSDFSSNLEDGNKDINMKKFGAKKFIHSIVGTFSSIQLNFIWFLTILIGCCFLVFISVLFLLRRKRKRKNLSNHDYEDNIDTYENHSERNNASMIPMLISKGKPSTSPKDEKSRSTDNNEQLKAPSLHHHHLYYSQMSDQISTPTTTTSIGDQQIIPQPIESHHFHDSNAGHLLLFNERLPLSDNAINEKSFDYDLINHHSSYAFYDLTQITTATSSLIGTDSSIDLPQYRCDPEEIEMKPFNSQYYPEQNGKTIFSDSEVNLLCIQQQNSQ